MSERSGRAGLARWFGGLGRAQQVAAVAVALVLGVNLTLAGIRSLVGGDPGGPTSSSFSTGGDGLAAYADLLRADGRAVTRLRARVGAGDLPTGATAVVADPEQLDGPEVSRLLAFVIRGGRLVLAGEAAVPLAEAVVTDEVRWERAGDEADRLAVWLPVDGTGAARELAGDRGGRLEPVDGLVAVAGVDGRAAVLAGDVGRGRVLLLADAGPLQNTSLDEADNAAFALALAGDADRPVVFVEAVHGYARSGLDAVPPAWKWTAAGLALALVAGLWAAGARFGPPEPDRRALRPPRRDHVEAVAAALDGSGASSADAVAPLAARTRHDLADHLGVARDASPAVLRSAAEEAGVPTGDVALLTEPTAGPEQALAVGALAARRQRSRQPVGRRPVARHPDGPSTGTVATDPPPGDRS